MIGKKMIDQSVEKLLSVSFTLSIKVRCQLKIQTQKALGSLLLDLEIICILNSMMVI